MATPSFDGALALHQAGRLDEAEAIYRAILAIDPRHFDSLHMLGAMAIQRQDYERAIEQIDLALTIRETPQAHFNRATPLRELGRYHDAIASLERAIALRPDYAEAHYNLGGLLLAVGDYGRGFAEYEWRLAVSPDILFGTGP